MWSSDPEADAVAISLTRMFVVQGLAAPSMRAIARETNAAASSLVTRLGGKEAMLARAASCFAEHYSFQLRDRAAWRGWCALLPRSEEDRYWTRARFSWAELGRAEDGVAASVAGLVRDELEMVRGTAEYPRMAEHPGVESPPERAVTAAHAVLLGLWERLLERVEPLRDADALEIWVSQHGVLRETSERSRN